jgi:hypothetical protein
MRRRPRMRLCPRIHLAPELGTTSNPLVSRMCRRGLIGPRERRRNIERRQHTERLRTREIDDHEVRAAVLDHQLRRPCERLVGHCPRRPTSWSSGAAGSRACARSAASASASRIAAAVPSSYCARRPLSHTERPTARSGGVGQSSRSRSRTGLCTSARERPRGRHATRIHAWSQLTRSVRPSRRVR